MIPEVVKIEFSGIFVKLSERFNLDDAIKKFKSLIKDSELMLNVQKHSEFTKPSAIKRDMKNRAKSRQRYLTKKSK